MSEEAKKTEEENLRWLIAEAGFVLDHPILLKIIEKAPSPKAADNFMLQLGWPNDLARRVRQAVRLKELYPKMWEEILVSNKKPEDMFVWDCDLKDSAISSVTSGIKFHDYNEVSKSQEVDLTYLPHYLKEIELVQLKETFCMTRSSFLPIETGCQSKFKFTEIYRDKLDHHLDESYNNLALIKSISTLVSQNSEKTISYYKFNNDGYGKLNIIVDTIAGDEIYLFSHYVTCFDTDREDWRPANLRATRVESIKRHEMKEGVFVNERDRWDFFIRIDCSGTVKLADVIHYTKSLTFGNENICDGRQTVVSGSIKFNIINGKVMRANLTGNRESEINIRGLLYNSDKFESMVSDCVSSLIYYLKNVDSKVAHQPNLKTVFGSCLEDLQNIRNSNNLICFALNNRIFK